MLSDQRKRTLYDAGLYDPDDEADEVSHRGSYPSQSICEIMSFAWKERAEFVACRCFVSGVL